MKELGTTEPGRRPWGWLVVLMLVVAFAVWRMASVGTNAIAPSAPRVMTQLAPTAVQPVATAPAPARAESAIPQQHLANVAAGLDYLRTHARNPASLKFVNVKVISKTGSVCFTYRAQNGFGGMTIEQSAYDARHGGMITPEDSAFREDWDKACTGKASTDITDAAQATLEDVQRRFQR
jgi:hypothetical protein